VQRSEDEKAKRRERAGCRSSERERGQSRAPARKRKIFPGTDRERKLFDGVRENTLFRWALAHAGALCTLDGPSLQPALQWKAKERGGTS